MPITRGTTPAINVKFSKKEIPDINSVMAFYFTFTQAGSIISALSRTIEPDYLSAVTGRFGIPETVTGSTATYTFPFTALNTNFTSLKITISSGSVTIDYINDDTVTVYSDGEWEDIRYSVINVPVDSLTVFETALTNGLNEFVSKILTYSFDPQVVKEDIDNNCYWARMYLDQSDTILLTPDIELVGTIDVVFTEFVPGSEEHKRGTTKTFSEMVCNSVLSDTVLPEE